jgi:hypothetical protein
MKAEWEECGGRILLGDNTGGTAVMLRLIRFRCAGIRILTGVPYIYIHSWLYIYTRFRLARDSICAAPCGTLTAAEVGECLTAEVTLYRHAFRLCRKWVWWASVSVTKICHEQRRKGDKKRDQNARCLIPRVSAQKKQWKMLRIAHDP